MTTAAKYADAKRPVRVLQVVTSLRVGGIQALLQNIRRRFDPEAVAMDFAVYCRGDEDGGVSLAPALEAMGSRVFVCSEPERPWRYAARLARVLRAHGPYDAVHAHLEYRSGLAMRVARRRGVPVRIVHGHTDLRETYASAPWWWRVYRSVMRRWIDWYATACLACSEPAGESLYGPCWRKDDRYRVLVNGIDLSPFRQTVDREAVRSELSLSAEGPVIGHVGRLGPVKNHAFLLKIFAGVRTRLPDARLLLVGDGLLRNQIEQWACALGVRDHVVFAGIREDVPRLMMGAMDCFVLPSRHEGLPLVGIEAQAAGLPVVLADHIAREVDAVPELVHRLSLDASLDLWVDRVLLLLSSGGAVTRVEALARLTASRLTIEACASELERIYQGRRRAEVTGADGAVEQFP